MSIGVLHPVTRTTEYVFTLLRIWLVSTVTADIRVIQVNAANQKIMVNRSKCNADQT